MIFAAALLLVPSVAYVGRSPPIGGASRPCVRHSPVRAAEAASEAEMVGEWELEEREDALSAFTLIELHAGGGVDVKATSGPPPARADGRWAISPDGDIEVTLTRYFSLAGKMLTTSVLVDDTDAYSTTRRYAGALERTEPINVNGEMLMAGDEFENAFSWSALDEEGAYGFFGTYTSPGVIARVELHAGREPRPAGRIELNPGEDNLYVALRDGDYAYFGTCVAEGTVLVKVHLPTFH